MIPNHTRLVGYGSYREWPESGLSKFEDILNGIGAVLRTADFFYFMDGDVRFNEEVLLADVAGGKCMCMGHKRGYKTSVASQSYVHMAQCS